LKKAFPSVNRVRLLQDLADAGVSDRAVAMLRRLYVSDTFQLLLDGIPGSMVFVVVSGVHEGSCLSPLLFIFFIRDLARSVNATPNIDAPLICGLIRSTLIYADDVTEMSMTHAGLQTEIDACYDFFETRELAVNPGKSEVMCFVSPRSADFNFTCNFRGAARDSVTSARYLGIVFDNHGKWALQKGIVAARSRLALGRCKVIVNTIGRHNTKHLIDLFDSLVSSIFRFGLGAWGPTAGKLTVLDDTFTNFICWLFSLPKTTCKVNILSCFGRRCALCDALFLATIQIAGAPSSRNELWKGVVADLRSGQKKSRWFKVVTKAMAERGFLNRVIERGADVVSERRQVGISFAQYCFHHHLNRPTRTSADDFRAVKPFGVYPFLFRAPPEVARFLFSFVLCNWRWLDRGKCRHFPRSCVLCQTDNTSWHILFECPTFHDERALFQWKTAIVFNYQALLIDVTRTACCAAETGKSIFERMCEMIV
jgi:hypothetical protein